MFGLKNSSRLRKVWTLKMKSRFNSCFVPNKSGFMYLQGKHKQKIHHHKNMEIYFAILENKSEVLLGKIVRNYWQYSSKYSQTIPKFVLKIYNEPIFKSLIFQLLNSVKIWHDLQFSFNGSIFGTIQSNANCSILYESRLQLLFLSSLHDVAWKYLCHLGFSKW